MPKLSNPTLTMPRLSRPARRPRTGSVTGLDIEPSEIVAAQARADGSGVRVERAVRVDLSPGSVREGEVVDSDQLGAALKELFAQSKLPKRVRVGLSTPRAVLRTVDVPPLSDPKDIAAAVRVQAPDQLPMPLDAAVIDHHSLGVVDTPDGKRTRTIVVAVQRDSVERLMAALRRAGLVTVGIDLSAFALVRGLARPATDEATQLYAQIGGMTTVAIAEGGVCRFMRSAPTGMDAMVARLAARRKLTLEHARGWLLHVGMATPLAEIDGETEIAASARAIAEEGADEVASELRTAGDFHVGQDGGAVVTSAVVTGPATLVPGFAEAVAERADMQVEVRSVQEGPPGALGDVDPEIAAVAAGLAVAEVPA